MKPRATADNMPPWPNAKVDPASYTILQRTAFEHGRRLAHTDVVETALAESRSVVDRARDALRRCGLDTADPAWAPLIREIGREIAAAEHAMLKHSMAIIRETLDTRGDFNS